MNMIIPKNIAYVMKKLENNGYEAYLVGGCVRDTLAGDTPKDYDITTNALPHEMVSVFGGMRVIETGIKHGTVTVVSGVENVEITTYRVDGEYSDSRRPDSVTFTRSLNDDLARRDFTVNAMAYNPKCGLVDNYGGRKDLSDGCIRCVGNPAERFGEDALRIMRALRFAARYGFDIHPDTAAAIHEYKYKLEKIAVERISAELTGIVTGLHPLGVMTEFSDVFSLVIPEVVPCVGFDQKSRYHKYDVWEHIAHSVESSACVREVRLALLFHDIEKPAVFRCDKEGHGHFKGHESRSAAAAETILTRMRFDKATIKTVTALIKYHCITPVNDRPLVKRLLRDLGFDKFEMLMEVVKGDNRAKEDFCLERANICDEMLETARDVISSGECFTLSALAVKGNDIKKTGFCGGQIAAVLDRLLEKVINGTVPNTKEALMEEAEKCREN